MSADDSELGTERDADLDMFRQRLREESGRGVDERQMAFASGFASGFADRVMARLEDQTRAPSLADGLQNAFRRLAPLAAAAVLFVAALNLVSSRSANLSVTERVIGLPAVTVASALTFDGELATWGK